MTKSSFMGLWHVRSGTTTMLILLAVGIFVALFPELGFAISLEPRNPPRGVGSQELPALMLAILLPVITIPRFDGRELLGSTPSRSIHLIYSLFVCLLPLAVIPIWVLRIEHLFPNEEMPSPFGLIGTPLFFAAFTTILSCLLSKPGAAMIPSISYMSLLVTQQLYPKCIVSSLFATERDWYTDWRLCIGSMVIAGAILWILNYRSLRR